MSKRVYQRQLPIFLASVMAGILIISYFADYAPLMDVEHELKVSASIMSLVIAIYAFVVRIVLNVNRVTKGDLGYRSKSFQASVIMLGTTAVFLILGVVLGSSSTLYSMVYKYMVSYSNSSVHVPWMLGGLYYVYLYMRPRTIESTVLFIFFFFTFVRGVTAIIALWPPLYDIAYWIESVPAMSVVRTFVVTAAIGTLMMGVRVLIGRERGIMEEEEVLT